MPETSRGIAYLTPGANEGWCWSPDREVVMWRDGSTIAFREELKVVLGALAPGGLPPFSSVVMLLSACRRGASEIPVWGLAEAVRSDVVEQLRALSALPSQLRTRVEAKCVIVQMVFQDIGVRRDHALNREIIGALSSSLADVDLEPRGAVDVGAAVATLEQGLAAFRADPCRIELRLRTGLDALPLPAPIDEAPGGQVRGLLDRLRDDRELAGLAHLAVNLMAVTALPRSLTSPEDVSVGGISDIANRGPLDRILVSELAHDDATLATRIALNEALYLRREAPPRSPPEGRAVFIDSGIRLWGVPRLFATAVAMAFAATGDPRSPIHTWHADGTRLVAVDLTTRSGLMAHLEHLSSEANPGAVLAELMGRCEDGDGGVDLVLVTHERVLADPQFVEEARRLLRDSPSRRAIYVATVNRRGDYRLTSLTIHGRKGIHAARLDLDDLMPVEPPVTVVDRAVGAELPVILGSRTFPLRLPHGINVNRCRYSRRDGVVAVTADGRLMLWDWPGRGARQLHDRVVAGAPLWLSLDDDDKARVVTGGDDRTVQVLEVGVADGFIEESRVGTKLLASLRTASWRQPGALHLVGEGAAWRAHGSALKLVSAPVGSRWVGGRFFERDGEWFALNCTGLAAVFEPFPLPPLRPRERVVRIFDRDLGDGPWAVTSAARAFPLGSDTYFELTLPLRPERKLLGISHDGMRMLVSELETTPGAAKVVLVDHQKGRVTPVEGPNREALEPDICARTRHSRQLRRRFHGVCVDATGLHLVTAAGEVLTLYTRRGRLRFLSGGECVTRSGDTLSLFTPVAMEGARYTLEVAHLPHGGAVYLDSRGLIHLRHEQFATAEITLVLEPGEELSGWSSQHGGFGDAFFQLLPRRVPTGEIWEDLITIVHKMP